VEAKILSAFLAVVSNLGLKVEITELDVDDRMLRREVSARDRAIADLTRRFHDVILGEKATRMVPTRICPIDAVGSTGRALQPSATIVCRAAAARCEP
jgi:hypothetical protein